MHDIENPIHHLKVRLSIVVDSEILFIFESRRLKKWDRRRTLYPYEIVSSF